MAGKDLVIQAVLKARDLMSAPTIKAAATLRAKLGGAMDATRTKGAGFVNGLKGHMNGLGTAWANTGGKLTNAFRGFIGGTANIVSKGLSLIGLGGIGAGIGIKSLVDNSSGLIKLKARTGIGVEALQELRYAGEKAGLSTEEFDKSLETMSRNVAMLKSNSGPLKEILDKVSPSFKRQLKNTKTNEEAFTLLARALGKIKDPQRRLLLASTAFGEAGGKLGALGELGADGLAKLREEAKKFGTNTQEEVEAGADMAKALKQIDKAVTTTGNTMLAALVPAIVPLLEGLSKWILANKSLFSDAARKYGPGLIAVTKFALGVASTVLSVLGSIGDAIGVSVGWIVRQWELLPGRAAAIWDTIKSIASSVADVIYNIFNPLIETPLAIFDGIIGYAKGFIKFLSGVFTLDFERALSGITDMWTAWSNTILRIWDAIKTPFRTVAKWMGMSGASESPASNSSPAQPTPMASRLAPAYGPVIQSPIPRAAKAASGTLESLLKGELTIKVEAAEGTSASVEGAKTNNRNVGITTNVGRRNWALGGI